MRPVRVLFPLCGGDFVKNFLRGKKRQSRLDTERNGDRVRRPGVEQNDPIRHLHPQMRVKGLPVDFVNHDIQQFPAERLDHSAEQIVGERPLGRRPPKFSIDRRRLKKTDYNGEFPHAVFLFEKNDLMLIELANYNSG